MKIRLTKVRECRRLTLWGWLLTAASVATAAFVWVVTIHDFLAVSKPLDTHIWVIEGYVSDSILDSVAVAAKKNPDMLVVCAGLPVEKSRLYSGYDNYAAYNASVLRFSGLDSLRVISAPTSYTNRERTYMTALTAREKLKLSGYASGKINVVCHGTHARRSVFLYRKAFGRDWEVGVISYGTNKYPPGSWWKSSEGARDVLYEMFAYLYCILFFHP